MYCIILMMVDQSKQWENILKVTARIEEDDEGFDENGSDFDDDSDDTKSTVSEDNDEAFARSMLSTFKNVVIILFSPPSLSVLGL